MIILEEMVLFYLILKLMPFEYMEVVTISALFVSVPILVKYAPIATDNNPLDDVERGHFRKKIIIHLFVLTLIIISLLLTSLIYYAFITSLGIITSSTFAIIQNMINKI